MSRRLITRPSNTRAVALREELLRFFEWDYCCAFTANSLERQTAFELDRMEIRGESEGLLWIQVSEEWLHEDMLRMFSTKPIRESLKKMASKGIIVAAKESIGKTKQILFDYHLLNRCVMGGCTVSSLPDADPSVIPYPIGKITDGNMAVHRENSRKIPVKFPEIDPALNNKVFQLQDTSIEPPTPLPETQRQNHNGESPILDTSDLYLEDPVEKFTQDAYSRINRMAKLDNLRAKSNAELCERIRVAEADYGAAEFRSRLIGFLEMENDWLRQTKWPIHAFLKDPSKYERVVRADPQTARDAPPPAAHDGASVRPFAKLTVFPEEADIWNEVVTSGTPVSAFDWEMDEGRNLAKCRNHSQFNMATWRRVCEKVQPVLAAGEGAWITFRWLIKDNNNWWKAYQGEYDNSAKPKSNGKGGKKQMTAAEMLKELGV